MTRILSSTAPSSPTLAELDLQESVNGSESYTAVFYTKPAVLALWLSKPAPWVKWRNIAGVNQVIHADDQHLLSSAQDKFNLGTADPVNVVARFLADDDGWRASSVRLTPYPGPLAKLLVIVQITMISDDV